jgi:hypothetical protein
LFLSSLIHSDSLTFKGEKEARQIEISTQKEARQIEMSLNNSETLLCSKSEHAVFDSTYLKPFLFLDVVLTADQAKNNSAFIL